MRSAAPFSLQGLVRLAAAIGLLLAFILIPFALWGDRLDAATPPVLAGHMSPWTVAAAGVALLVLDVLLPIPGSVVCVALCVLLGPVAGGVTIMTGMVGAFVAGHAIGRLVPGERLRSWLGPALWDACMDRGRAHGLAWVAATRPVPVLAELTAVLTGVLGLSLCRSMPVVVGACACVAAAYALSVWVGLQQSSAIFVFCIGAALPTLAWMVYRAFAREAAAGAA